jgi:DNA-binding Xre family transcriptional regulator
MEKRNISLTPKNPVASYVDQYGDLQVIHRSKGRRLSVFKGGDTPALRMNRAASILIGQKIKAMRLQKKMSQKNLCLKAGLANVNPKQYIHAIESATRMAGCKTGTLYAIAYALDCEVSDLIPTVREVLEYANMTESTVTALN